MSGTEAGGPFSSSLLEGLTEERWSGPSISSLDPTSSPPGCGTGSPGPKHHSQLQFGTRGVWRKAYLGFCLLWTRLSTVRAGDVGGGGHDSSSISQSECPRPQSMVPEATGGGRAEFLGLVLQGSNFTPGGN